MTFNFDAAPEREIASEVLVVSSTD